MEKGKSRSNGPGAGGFKKARPSFKRGGAGASKGGFRGKPSGGRGRSFGGGRKRGGRGGGGRGKVSFDPSQFINKNPVQQEKEVAYEAKHTFNDFTLDDKLVETIHGMGITIPSPIQDQIIPEILKGHDVIGLAETGTGKTAAFLIPIIQQTIYKQEKQTLILTPTRELAIQIEQEFRKLARGYKMFSTVCVGGMPIYPQIRSLKRTNQFIIGTPGRVMDLIERKSILPENISTVVLDEADRMLDMGFVNDMKFILGKIPKDRETLFFSATMTKGAENIVDDFLNKPVKISVKKKETTNSIEQDVVKHGRENKYEILLGMLKKDEFERVIIFGAMKHSVEDLSKKLIRDGIKSESIHGNKNHRQRQSALKRFKAGQSDVLVATDVAARGIHVDDVTHVINYDLPQQFEDYVHRIGRTGRGTKRGIALTFVPDKPERSSGGGSRARSGGGFRKKSSASKSGYKGGFKGKNGGGKKY